MAEVPPPPPRDDHRGPNPLRRLLKLLCGLGVVGLTIAVLPGTWSPLSLLDSSHSSPTLGRLDLELPPTANLEVQVTHSATPGDGLTDWEGRTHDPETTVSPTPGTFGEDLGLRVAGGATQEVFITGQFDPQAFNSVTIDVYADEDVSLRLGVQAIRSAGSEEPYLGGSLDIGFVLAGTRQEVSFDLRNLPDDVGPLGRLLILGRGKQPDWTVFGVRFVQKPALSWLPGGSRGPALVAIEGDSRRAQGLAPGAPLSCRVQVPERGRLSFAYAALERFPILSPAAEVVVFADSTELGRCAPPHPRTDQRWQPGPWNRVELDLSRFAGDSVQLRFELQDPEYKEGGDHIIALGEATVFASEPDPATVLLVTSDTHRADHLGHADSDHDVLTPALDSLAAQGVTFTDCFSTTNITLASHAALLTGVHPRDSGITNNRTRMAAHADTLAERFAEAGYATIAVTSAKHMNDPWSGLGLGFDRMSWPMHELERGAGASISLLRDWMLEHEGRPLFIWLHLYDAHRPYEPPQGFAEQYYPDNRDPRATDLPDPLGPLPPHLDGVRDLDYVRALYRGEISSLDRALGELLAEPRLQTAIVALTGDHGESLGEQGLWWDHVGVYPSVLHVPLILRWPGSPQGLRVNQPLQHTGLGSTLLALADLPASTFPGEDLRVYLDGLPIDEPRFAWGEDGHAMSITHRGWHLVINLDDTPIKPALSTTQILDERPIELFHLERDPSCQHNCIEQEQDVVRNLAPQLLAWVEGAGRALAQAQNVDRAGLALIAALGYASGEGADSTGAPLNRARERLKPYLED